MAARKTAVEDPGRESVENMGPAEAGLTAEEAGASQPEEGGYVRLIYIGPSLPYEKIRSSMILTGTEQEIGEFLADIREKYPEVTHLLVPPEQLTEALRKVSSRGTILHKYYEDMLAKSRASRKG